MHQRIFNEQPLLEKEERMIRRLSSNGNTRIQNKLHTLTGRFTLSFNQNTIKTKNEDTNEDT